MDSLTISKQINEMTLFEEMFFCSSQDLCALFKSHLREVYLSFVEALFDRKVWLLVFIDLVRFPIDKSIYSLFNCPCVQSLECNLKKYRTCITKSENFYEGFIFLSYKLKSCENVLMLSVCLSDINFWLTFRI